MKGSTHTERAASQEHFIDLCRMIGAKTPNEADPTGDWYAFEKGAEESGGGGGFADVWKRGYFAWKYKGKRKDLGAAYDQLLQYREASENPPLLVVCDLDRVEIHTNFTNVDTLFGQLLRRMGVGDDPAVRYAVVVPPRCVAKLKRVPARIARQLRIDVYAADPDSGTVSRL